MPKIEDLAGEMAAKMHGVAEVRREGEGCGGAFLLSNMGGFIKSKLPTKYKYNGKLKTKTKNKQKFQAVSEAKMIPVFKEKRGTFRNSFFF